MNIILSGLPASGKSSVAKALAVMLGWTFCDTDQLIEEEGLSCRELYLKHGEEHFRKREKEAIFRLISAKKTVIATGGGALCDEDCRTLLQKIGSIVYLQADIQVLWERLVQRGLPAFLSSKDPQESDSKESFIKMAKKRIPIYEQTAYLIVNTDGLDPEIIAKEILKDMASNSFGTLFKITTWGESHGKAVGVCIDGCPAGILLNVEDINEELAKRAPGRSSYTSPRGEQDKAEIFSGVFEGKTTGAPISIIIPNKDADSSKYEPIKDLLRPGHANYTYLQKYGIFDWKGGGRASARETACRVAAGAVAKKILELSGISLAAYLCQICQIKSHITEDDLLDLSRLTYESPVFCPDKQAASLMMERIEKAKEEGDSLGGIVRFIATGLPAGLGDPIYEKLEAKLGHAMMSLPASKGFEIGSGFESVYMQGSEHNDLFIKENDAVATKTNFAGGTLGGISTGQPLCGQVAFKPTSSIKKAMPTLSTAKEGEILKEAIFQLPEGSRHDPCVAIRAVPVVEAMLALVLVDSLLLQRTSKI